MERVAVDGNENDKGWFMVIIKKEKKEERGEKYFSISKNENKLEDGLWINLLIIVKYSFIYLFVFFFDKYLIILIEENFHIILINLIIFILYIIHHVYTLFRSYIYKYIS